MMDRIILMDFWQMTANISTVTSMNMDKYINIAITKANQRLAQEYQKPRKHFHNNIMK